ncbi:DUF1931 family protein [Streptomyces sp. R08]|uniref:DUF1931 family protein n=1 Tax=Streptomyces sp. R08 TaxID=3238624 RepID=A0AB39MCC3_9ACTN
MTVMGVSKFERFFRVAASLDVDKNDLKRYGEFVDAKLYDFLVIGQASAKANGRDTVEPWDLPITKGLQESIHRFRRLDEEIELKLILEQLAAHPPLDRTPTPEVEERYPEIIGGLSVALAETFNIMYPDVRNPQTRHWDGVTAVFDRLL